MEEKKEERIEYKIYKIICNETCEIYFGKTTLTLEERLSNHIRKLNCTSRIIILRGNYYIEQINSTFDEKESIILERYYIETFECVNKQIPGRSKNESDKKYYEAHKEEIIEKSKKYREAHKEEILEKSKKYREAHKDEIEEKRKQKYTCECGSILRKSCKARHEKTLLHINFINSK